MLDPCGRLAFPLDVSTLAQAKPLVEQLAPHVGVFKVGLQLYTAEGPAAVRLIKERGARCFLDLKLHDIPNTMAEAVRAAQDTGADLLTVHASAGPAAMGAVVAAAEGSQLQLLAVTVLTSMDEQELASIGMSGSPAASVERLASMASATGLDGFVTSPEEVASLRARLGAGAYLVTPGIRPAGSDAGDQRRVATPARAVESGADLLVVGRPIRDAADPAAAAAAIAAEIDGAVRAPGQ